MHLTPYDNMLVPITRIFSGMCTYLRHLEQNLPDAEVIQATLEPSLSKEIFEIAVLTELGLNIKVVLRLP